MSMDISDFYQTFFDEADELLADMEQHLLVLQPEAPDAEQLNAIFRAAHSIKGGAGTFGFSVLQETTHLMENLLDEARRGEMQLNTDIINLFLETKDIMQEQLDAYKQSQEPDAASFDYICQALRQLALEAKGETPVGSVTGFFLWHHWPQMMRLMAESPITAMGNAMDLVGLCALLVVLGVIPMVGFDVFFQIFSHLKKLRMSRQDIRDEFKQSEGDPHVKGRIRQMQRAAARRRMMADVPKADVIVNNPTHYSVALQYDENKMSAPKVVAKGAGLVALRIREIGAENNVPTLEAPPLARALYRHAEIGQQIPGQLYAAVAEVLAWVWQLKRWRLAGGQRPVQPTHLPVPEALDFINEKPTHE